MTGKSGFEKPPNKFHKIVITFILWIIIHDYINLFEFKHEGH